MATTNKELAAVAGKPIAHSLSPVLHNAAYRALGLDGTYGRYEIAKEDLAQLIHAPGPHWLGLSLTMPLKHAALSLVDVLEPLAEVVGAVNTVLYAPGGLKVGANTDVYGIVEAIRRARGEVESKPRNGVIIGGGATASSAVAALGQLGITTPTIIVRSLGRAGAVIRASTSMGVEPTYLNLGTPASQRAISSADILISTIPGGASAALIDDVAPSLAPHNTLLDVVYEGWPTPLPREWQARGGTVAPGFDMLLYQAAEQVRLMTGRSAPVDAMRAALHAALKLG